MQPFRLTLRNYRCFERDAPLVVEIHPGFTALVGPNNAGKSSVLKFLHEMRNLWDRIATGEADAVLNGRAIGVNYHDVVDPIEVFCNSNDGDLSFVLELLDVPLEDGAAHVVTGMRAQASRQGANNWHVRFFHGEAEIPAKPASGSKFSSPALAVVEGQRFSFAPLFGLLSGLTRCLFIPAFRNAINEGSGQYYGMAVGSSFIAEWHAWKVGGQKARALAIEDVTEDIRKVFGFSRLEINAAEQHKTLQISIDRQPYRMAELGSGLAQFILIFGNAAIRRPSLILIDEPEINLHPTLQIAFLTALGRYGSGNVVYATHSIGLARSTAEKIYSFQRRDGRPIVRRFEATTNYSEFVGEMSFSASQELGFGAILLVEGVTDVKVYQQFLRMLRKDSSIVVVPLGGDQMIRGGVEQELAELTRITPNVFAIVDSERTAAEAIPETRLAFQKACDAVGINAHLTERRAIEHYFPAVAIQAVVSDKCTALEPYAAFPKRLGWSKSLHNWQIASRMSRADFEDTDIGTFLVSVLETTTNAAN